MCRFQAPGFRSSRLDLSDSAQEASQIRGLEARSSSSPGKTEPGRSFEAIRRRRAERQTPLCLAKFRRLLQRSYARRSRQLPTSNHSR